MATATNLFRPSFPRNYPNTRNQSLDVLRCIAVLLVLGVHLPYYHVWAYIGWVGVDLFFVLSGFLISGLLFRDYQQHGRIDWRRFLIRRGFKIYPSFYVFLIGSGLILFSTGHAENLSHALRINAIFLTNYHRELLVAPWGHLWSVAVEEHFYVLLPVLLVLLAKRGGPDPFRWILVLFPLAALTCLVFRCFAPLGQIIDATHMRLDSLLAGVTLGYLYHFRRRWFDWLTTDLSLSGAAILCSPTIFLRHESRAMQTWGLASLYVGFALLVAWSIGRSPRGRVMTRVSSLAASVGFYSYSIYLWHNLLAMAFVQWAHSAIGFWLYVAASLCLGIGMSKLIEMPP